MIKRIFKPIRCLLLLTLSVGAMAQLKDKPGGQGIDKGRLLAVGVANVAPVASNANEAGRAQNRRVEMVLQ